MKRTLWVLDKVFGRRIAVRTREHLARVVEAPARASRARTMSLLEGLTSEPGPHVVLGETEWGQPVRLPLQHLLRSHSAIHGATGSGKSFMAMLLIGAILNSPDSDLSMGVLDGKGELFGNVLGLLARRLDQLPPADAERLRERVVLADLSSQDPLTAYNIAAPWAGSDLDFFAHSRVEMLQELLPGGDGFSTRGGSIVKHVLKLLAEVHLPFSYFDRVLSEEAFRARLLARTDDQEVHYYFRTHFPSESRATIAAVRARLASTLFGSESLRLALSGSDAPDFRLLQDEGKIVLINCAGPNISRTTAHTLQALLVSDIRQAVFARRTQTPFLWICDEAQALFRTRPLRENMVDLLTMSRSFGSFFLYLTQNLASAVADSEMLEILYSNIRWSLTMRGTSRDGGFLQAALPITGLVRKPCRNPYAPPEFYSPAEERALLVGGLASLPDRVGWLWLKSLTGEAFKIRTRTFELPQEPKYQESIRRIRSDARIGRRFSRAEFLSRIVRLDAEFREEGERDVLEQLKESYRLVQGGLE